VDGQSSSGNDSSLLLRKGQPDPSTVVVMHQEVYADLRRAAVARLPGGTAGALLGNVQALGTQQWYTVREAAPLDLEFTENGLSPERGSLERLRDRVESEPWQDLSVIGMFYADPEIGLFPARMDIGEIHRQITPDASLVLLMNPSIDQGAFCLWREGLMLPVGGFYEALPEQSTSLIPWTGDWATMIIGAAGSLRRGDDRVRGRAGRAERTDQPPDRTASTESEPVDALRFKMRESARPANGHESAASVENDAAPPPEESMAADAIERITVLARKLEAESNLTGAVLLYRQALSLAPIIGDIALELRLRSTLNRLEEQAKLLEQDITQKASAAWAEARARAEQSESEGRGKAGAASQTAGRQRTAVDELFDLGLAAFWQGDLLHARNVLAEVVRQEPSYRTEQHRAVNLLAGIERRLALPPPTNAGPSSAAVTRNVVKSTAARWRGIAMVALPVVAVALVFLFAFSTLAPASAPQPRTAPAQPSGQSTPSTAVLPTQGPLEAIAAFVATNGGAARFGAPVSPVMAETSGGITRTVQYYERGLLAYDAAAAQDSTVTILPLGKLELERLYPQGAPTPGPATGDDLYFEATGFAVAGAIREYWEQSGNSIALGRPVSGLLPEAAEGQAAALVQYFEYGALRQPPNDPNAKVEVVSLGRERYQALYENR
jgi:hypothetical protein